MIRRKKPKTEATQKIRKQGTKKWEHMKHLQEEDHVWFRTEDGKSKIKWEHSGIIKKVDSYDKYRIKSDSTGRLLNRHRQDIKLIERKTENNKENCSKRRKH